MDVELLALFALLGAVILTPAILKERTKRVGLDLAARAIERGQTLDPEVIIRLTDEKLHVDRRRHNLAIGAVLWGLAAGCLASAAILVAVEPDAQLQDFLVPAALLASVGAAFLLLGLLDRTSPRP